MAEKEEKGTAKPVRVQFGRDSTADAILNRIHMAQDNWALERPQRAHDLYPTVWDINGKRIKKD